MQFLRQTTMVPVALILAAFVLFDYLLYLVSGFDAFALTVAGGLGTVVALAFGRDGIAERFVRTMGASAALVLGVMPGIVVFARGFAWAATPYDFLLVAGLAVATVLGFGGVFLLRYQLDQMPQRSD